MCIRDSNKITPYIAVHEQNSKAGRANRYIAMWRARAVIEGFPSAFDWKTRIFQTETDDLIFLGNPVRNEILNVNRKVDLIMSIQKILESWYWVEAKVLDQ